MKTNKIIFLVALLLATACGGRRAAVPATRNFPQATLPGMLTDPQERLDYMVRHFWDAFADTTGTWTCDSTLVAGVPKDAVEEQFGLFATLLGQVVPPTVEAAMVRMYDRAAAVERRDTASNLFETLIEFSEKYFFDPNSPVRSEDAYLPFVSRLAGSDLVRPGMRQAYAYDAGICRLNRTGTQAADFRFTDLRGRSRNLHGVQAPYTLLFFSNPGCEACKAIIDDLKASARVLDLISSGTLAVVNVYIDQDLEAWRDYAPTYPAEWLTGYDADYAIRTDLLYAVRAIPSLYLLDADKTVLLKDVPPEKMFSYLENPDFGRTGGAQAPQLHFVRNLLPDQHTMDIQKEIWGTAPDGKEILKYRLTNASGAYVELTSVGAAIVSIVVPDKDGKLDNVVYGFDDAAGYLRDGACAGKCPGRFANRIAGGRFTLDGKTYELPVNNGQNSLHGGPKGFHTQIWESRIDGEAVEFMYFSEDGEAGYPGNLKVVARYEWDDDNALRLTFTAETDAPTVLNMTNHVYFNLDNEGTIEDHELQLFASEYLPTDKTQIPLGDSEPVAGTPMAFINPKPIGRDLHADFEPLKIGSGYDHCWVLDDYQPGQLQPAAELFGPDSGRVLRVLTTQPGIQVYTGNWLNGTTHGGRRISKYGAVALECQHFPDSPNKPDYPTTTLRPGEIFEEAIIFEFSTR